MVFQESPSSSKNWGIQLVDTPFTSWWDKRISLVFQFTGRNTGVRKSPVKTLWDRILQQNTPIKYGVVTSPKSGLLKDGSIWLLCWICILDVLWAGIQAQIWEQNCHWKPWIKLWCYEKTQKEWSTILIEGLNIPLSSIWRDKRMLNYARLLVQQALVLIMLRWKVSSRC